MLDTNFTSDRSNFAPEVVLLMTSLTSNFASFSSPTVTQIMLSPKSCKVHLWMEGNETLDQCINFYSLLNFKISFFKIFSKVFTSSRVAVNT